MFTYYGITLFFGGVFLLLYLAIYHSLLQQQIRGKLRPDHSTKPEELFSKLKSYVVKVSFALIVPYFVVRYKATKKQKKIRREIPIFIDYMTIAVEAGLGLDLAIHKVINTQKGPLTDEFNKTMTEIKYGKSKKDAFRELAHRINLPEFTSFITMLINAEQLGVSLGNVLRTQGKQIREKRRQQAQEEAYKTTVKLLFPLIVFIFPGLLIVLLGPALIQIKNMLF
ncbi:pilus assembly protein TadC [Desulfitispora alkaliphila]|uniref:type II secretion system F family protein n=1 Tax=Desulfitispora alkaliphila TaxID=622674 RepID=UPI003D250B29